MDKTAGDAVSSGTVNQFGAFEMEKEMVKQKDAGCISAAGKVLSLYESLERGETFIF